MSENAPTTPEPAEQPAEQPDVQPGKQPGARKADKADKADKGTKAGASTTGTRKATTGRTTRLPKPNKRLLLALAALLAIALTTTLTIALRDPADLGPLDRTIPGDPTVNEADRILIDQDNDGTPDTVLDLNNNNRADKGEPSLAELAHQRTTITTKIAANPKTIHESLITPPGDNWWTFTTSQAADLLLWDTDTPTNATWYGVTTGTAVHPEYPTPTYHALHIGFPTADDALTYMKYVGVATGPRIRGALRGTVVTLTATHVDPYAEPFPKTGDTLDATNASLHPTAAAWTLNLGKQHTDLAQSAYKKAWGTALNDYHRNLGFTPTTIWNGVAATPEGPWMGTLTGYNPGAIDLPAASKAITGTQKFRCTKNGQACQDVGPSLTGLALYASAATNSIAIGGIDRANPNAEPAYAPTGTTLIFTANNTAIRGITEGTLQAPEGPYTLMRGAITTGARDQHILTVTFTEAKQTTNIPTELPEPNIGPDTTPPGGKNAPVAPEPTQPGDPVESIKPGKDAPPPPTDGPPAS